MGPYAAITGWGMAVPRRLATNHDLVALVNTSDEWIRSRTGIAARYIAGEGETSGTLGAQAARQALTRAGIEADSLDLIVCATCTPDYPAMPATACVIQQAIGATRAAAFDASAACSGFVYGLAIGAQFIAGGLYRRVLVIGADTLTRYLDWTDRRTCVLFGDGAGAVVLEASATPAGLLSLELGADGAGGELLCVPAGGGLNPLTAATLGTSAQFLQMNGREVYKFGVRIMVEATASVVRKAGLSLDDITLFVPHQANSRIIEFGRRHARPVTRSRAAERRSLRQHLGRLGPDRAVRGGRGRPPEARRPCRRDRHGRWADLGRRRAAVDAPRGRGAQRVGRARLRAGARSPMSEPAMASARVAWVFPGQGSQAVGMGRALAEADPASAALFHAADEALGQPLSRTIFDGPAERLQQTDVQQPAIVLTSVAYYDALERRGRLPAPACLAGHSLGQYSAMVAAGVAGAGRRVAAGGRARPADAIVRARLDGGNPQPGPGDCGGGGDRGWRRDRQHQCAGPDRAQRPKRGDRGGDGVGAGARRAPGHPAPGERRLPLVADATGC